MTQTIDAPSTKENSKTEANFKADGRLQEGRSLGDYKLLRFIGHGPLGAVWAAEHRFTKKNFALKLLPEELSSDRSFILRFEEQVAQLSTLEHPSIAKIHNVSFAGGFYFLACDCVVDDHQQTINLYQYLVGRGGKLSEQEVFAILKQVASALDYAHGEGHPIAHLNLKPNNVLISGRTGIGEPQVKITDFGLVKIIGLGPILLRSFKSVCESLGFSALTQHRSIHDRYQGGAVENARSHTLLNSLRQNVAFLSPEQKLNDTQETIDPVLCDIWSFGALTYWLLTGGNYPEGYMALEEMASKSSLCDWSSLLKTTLARTPSDRALQLLPLLNKRVEAVAVPQEAQNVRVYQPDAPQVQQVEESAYERPLKHVDAIHTETVLIEDGAYSRGCSFGCRDEMPRHPIRLDPFKIDIHPVTNEQFVRFLDHIGGEKDSQYHDVIRLKDSRIKRAGGKCIIERGYGKHPVVGVTWYGAVAYAKWVGKRLPTEAEWEVACSGGLENAAYPTGEHIEKSQANFFSNDTTPVLSYPPNGYGLFDMAGNVYEWCADWYDYAFYEVSQHEPDNPKGPLQGVYRVLRGGCWKSLKEDLRCAKRHRNNPGSTDGTYGFRCAQDAS